MRRSLPLRSCALAIIAALSACSLAPTYHQPDVGKLPASFAGQTQEGLWSPAHPADTAPRGPWWSVYGDAQLDRLERQLDDANPSLSVALARYDAARAIAGEMRSDLYPHLGVGASDLRNRQSDHRPLRGSNQPNEYSAETFGFGAGYELDLWGRVRNEVAAGKASASATQADLASAKLSLEAQLADLYIRLRGYDVQQRILKDTLDAYRQALDMTQRRFEGGIASGLDVSRARTQLSDAMAQVSEVEAQRGLAEHAVATLVGEPASRFTLAPAESPMTVPAIPLGVPSTLLQRRPDIAAAERRTAEANARIGVARSAFFPSLTLSAGGGFSSGAWGNLLTAPSQVWALGPSLLLDVFDGGRRRAQVDAAHAAFDEASAHYRSTVLTAFQQVEDNQSLLNHYGHALVDQNDATHAADRTLKLSMALYKQGANSYLDVVTAQVASLNAHLTLLGLQTNQLRASVGLVRALGGGWSSEAMATGALAQGTQEREAK